LTTGNKSKEKILCGSFLSLLRETTGRDLRVKRFGDKPDAICIESRTNKRVGIEITELLKSQQGLERSWSERSAQTVTDVLKKYARGGVISVGVNVTFPRSIQQRKGLRDALEKSILEAGGFQRFALMVNSSGQWEYEGFIITEISANQTEDDWLCISDGPLAFQSISYREDDLIETVRKKAILSTKYEEVDELILVIRNPGTTLEPNENLRKRVTLAMGNRIHCVWVINWKVGRLPARPNIICIANRSK
jgi:hypothetical protein